MAQLALGRKLQQILQISFSAIGVICIRNPLTPQKRRLHYMGVQILPSTNQSRTKPRMVCLLTYLLGTVKKTHNYHCKLVVAVCSCFPISVI